MALKELVSNINRRAEREYRLEVSVEVFNRCRAIPSPLNQWFVIIVGDTNYDLTAICIGEPNDDFLQLPPADGKGLPVEEMVLRPSGKLVRLLNSDAARLHGAREPSILTLSRIKQSRFLSKPQHLPRCEYGDERQN